MAGALRAVGKFLKGVSDVAVPMALEQHRANILAKRDAILNDYNSQQMKAQQEFTTTENQAQREFTSGENAANRDFQAQQGDLNRALDQARLDLQQDQSALDATRVQSIVDLTNLQIKDLGLDMRRKEQVNALQQAVVDAATPEAQDAALTKLQGFLGQELFSPMTLYGEAQIGEEQPRMSGVINRVTGGFTPMGPGTGGQGSVVNWSDLE